MTDQRRPPIASDAWMLEQQTRAEFEAEGWRQLRAEVARAEAEAARQHARAYQQQARLDDGEIVSHSAILKGLVRFLFGALGAYVAWIAVMDSGGGSFEAWMWVGMGFVITLALTAFGPGRQLVHVIAEGFRWTILLGLCVGLVWVMVQMQGS